MDSMTRAASQGEYTGCEEVTRDKDESILKGELQTGELIRLKL